jgi:cytosine permease
MSNRLGFFSNLMVLSGFILMVTSLLSGGSIGSVFSLNQAVPIIIFGVMTTAFMAILVGVIGTRTGYSTPLIYRFSFGSNGVILPNIILAVAGLGWIALSVNIVRDAFAGMYGVEAHSGTWWFVTIATFIVFVIPAFKSVKWLSFLNWVAAPTIVGILLFVFYYSITKDPGVWNKSHIADMSVLTGVTLAIGGWIQGAAVIADFTRFLKNSKQALLAITFSFGFLILFQFLGGAIGAASTGDWNIFNILTAMGIGAFAFIGVFFSAWSTCSSCLYGASLEMSAPPIPEIKDQETTRRIVVIILSILTFVGILIGIEGFIFWYLPFLTFIVAPLIANVIVDYWLLAKRRILYEEGLPDMKINPAAYLSWIIGFIVGVYTNSIEFGSGAINSLVASAVIYYGWMNYALSHNTTPEKQLRFGVRVENMDEGV